MYYFFKTHKTFLKRILVRSLFNFLSSVCLLLFLEDEDDEDDDEDEDDDDDDDDDVAAPPPEGMYDPSDFEHLNVSADIKELFGDILR